MPFENGLTYYYFGSRVLRLTSPYTRGTDVSSANAVELFTNLYNWP